MGMDHLINNNLHNQSAESSEWHWSMEPMRLINNILMEKSLASPEGIDFWGKGK